MMASHASNDGMVFICAGLTLGALVTAVASFLLLKKGRQEKAAQANGEAQHAIDDSERWPAGPLSIYFGSQTGTAEGFAKTLAAEGARKGFNTQVVDLEDFNEFQLAEAGKAIFIMATYGEGDPTDNAMAFMDWLKQADKDASLASTGLRYTAFGLGNRQYEHYNRTGKATHAGLAEAGAELMFEYGEGDDDGTLEDDFEPSSTSAAAARSATTCTARSSRRSSRTARSPRCAPPSAATRPPRSTCRTGCASTARRRGACCATAARTCTCAAARRWARTSRRRSPTSPRTRAAWTTRTPRRSCSGCTPRGATCRSCGRSAQLRCGRVRACVDSFCFWCCECDLWLMGERHGVPLAVALRRRRARVREVFVAAWYSR
eukprot:TRINITY_DN699_c0_g1_i1.p1 TRINITY_DN699_c0_g1~~TRINITY_DN699_c0_g1_i1.p1  ORF type:complete len:376 (-),score=47.55 TRINITY_DN699_c0_g1_i1:161-1288(-)